MKDLHTMALQRIPGEHATLLWFTRDDLADESAAGYDGFDIDRFDDDALTPEYLAKVNAGALTGIPSREALATCGPTRTAGRNPKAAAKSPDKPAAKRSAARTPARPATPAAVGVATVTKPAAKRRTRRR
jgi:hypothetical protein